MPSHWRNWKHSPTDRPFHHESNPRCRRVHEPVFGVLALESEPVASRLRHPARTVTGKRQALKGAQPSASMPKSLAQVLFSVSRMLAGWARRDVFWFDHGVLKAGSLGNARRKTLRKVPIPRSDSPMTPAPLRVSHLRRVPIRDPRRKSRPAGLAEFHPVSVSQEPLAHLCRLTCLYTRWQN